MDIKRKLQDFDYIMLFLVCVLSIFGIIIIGSAKHVYQGGMALEYERQQLWFATGFVMMLVTSFIDYKFIMKFFWAAYIVNVGLLVFVLLFGRTMETANVTRSIAIGPVALQPSEFAKLFMIVYLAGFIDKYNEKINNFFVLMFLGISIVIPVILVQRQPSLSASLVVLCVSLIMIYVGGLSYKYIIGGVSILLPAASLLITDILREEPLFTHKLFKGYQLQERLIPYFRPEEASAEVVWQTMQSVRAIGSGQLTGKGLYNGTLNQLNYLPSSHNDFIFAVIGEELGFAGCMAVIAVIALLIIKCMIIAYKSDTMSGRLIASGVGFMFAFQTFVNIGVATKLLPNTGMALPFISYGGSSMWINMIAVGLVINVGMAKKPKSIFEE